MPILEQIRFTSRQSQKNLSASRNFKPPRTFAKIAVVTITYSDAVKWYYSFARFEPRPPRKDVNKLERMRAILARLDNPHDKFPSTHIAGTKGKGSTAALLESMFRAGGYRTGLFTSPHLHTFRERVRVNNQCITEQELVAYTERLRALAPDFADATFFEWVTALAFLYFAERGVEMGIIEVGLGGRLDCTNVITPRVTVITPISLDHTEILGKHLTDIAREKAGILKPGVPVVIAPQELRALGEIQRRAYKVGVRMINVKKNWRWELIRATPEAQTVRARYIKNARWHTFTLPLLGPHQRDNLATALATMDVLHGRNWRISLESLAQGVAKVEWPARFEILARLNSSTNDASDNANESANVETPTAHGYFIADGAHNAASARQVTRTLAEVFPNAPAHFIFAASADKDIEGMLRELAPRAATFTLTQASSPRAASLETLAVLAARFPVKTYSAPDLAQAIVQLFERIEPTDIVCVTGSLFIAAEARAYFYAVPSDD